MHKVFQLIFSILNLPLLPVGNTTVTVALLIYIILLLAILIVFSRIFRRRVLEKLLSRSKLDRNLQNAFAMLLQYSIVGLGVVIILNTAGIQMTALTVVAGALGLGLSLGLQSLAKNVAGGVMILLERPIRIGDRIQIGVTAGDVTHIALRSTTVRNDDHIDIIVPNADFMDQRVCNWTYSTQDVILNIPVVVSNENELAPVQKIMLDCASAHPRVLADPAPEVLLDSFEGGKLKLILRIATTDHTGACAGLKSELLSSILARFREAQVKLGSQAPVG